MSSKDESRHLLESFCSNSQQLLCYVTMKPFTALYREPQTFNRINLFFNNNLQFFLLGQDGEYKTVPTSQDQVINLTMTPSQPVTYSWEDMTVFYETVPGNCFSRLFKKSPPVQKKILDNGILI